MSMDAFNMDHMNFVADPFDKPKIFHKSLDTLDTMSSFSSIDQEM